MAGPSISLFLVAHPGCGDEAEIIARAERLFAWALKVEASE